MGFVFVLLAGALQAQAGVSVHINIGGYGCGYQGGYCGRGYSACYAPRYCSPFAYGGFGYAYPSTYFYGASYPVYASYPVETYAPTLPPPVPAPAPTPVTTAAPAQVQQVASSSTANQVPYGFDLGTKLIKSPWSGFVINGANKAPEQIVFDANTGQAFRIPPSS